MRVTPENPAIDDLVNRSDGVPIDESAGIPAQNGITDDGTGLDGTGPDGPLPADCDPAAADEAGPADDGLLVEIATRTREIADRGRPLSHTC